MSPKAVEDDFVFPWRHAMYHPIWWLTLRPIPNFERLEIRMRADANTFQHICHMPSTSQRNGFAFSKEVMEVLLSSILQESAWNPRSTNYSSERWFSPMTLCTVNARTKAVLQRIIKCFANECILKFSLISSMKKTNVMSQDVSCTLSMEVMGEFTFLGSTI